MTERLRHLSATLLCTALCVVLGACEEEGNSNRALRLAACTAEGSVFEDKPFDEWKKTYHDNVNEVIELHLQMVKGLSAMPLQCTAKDYRSVIPASPSLKKVAEMLPTWKERAKNKELRESDMPAVLLEFLRVYECSMNDHLHYLPINATSSQGIPIWELSDKMEADGAVVEQEKLVSREALERALSLTGGFDRLTPLSIDIECLKRSSLDMRNTLGLASDISSCLPRIWDAKGSLRDLAE